MVVCTLTSVLKDVGSTGPRRSIGDSVDKEKFRKPKEAKFDISTSKEELNPPSNGGIKDQENQIYQGNLTNLEPIIDRKLKKTRFAQKRCKNS